MADTPSNTIKRILPRQPNEWGETLVYKRVNPPLEFASVEAEFDDGHTEWVWFNAENSQFYRRRFILLESPIPDDSFPA
jgi:hypothetical protein